MKWLALIALLASTAAVADPAVPKKKTPDKFARAAADAFTEALAADEKGDLPTALGLYEKAQAIAPHPSTAYNLGDLYRRQGNNHEAILHFEMYLAMLPNAPDRAYVEGLIDKLDKTPATILLGTSPKSDPKSVSFREFYILLDGEIVDKPGTQAKIEPGSRDPVVAVKAVGSGRHRVDMVSSISWTRMDCRSVPGATEHCLAHAEPRVDGHLVVSAVDTRIGIYLEGKVDGERPVADGRYEVPPGKRRIQIRDRSFECRAVDLDVPSGPNDVLYLYVGTTDYDGYERCRNLDIKIKKLHFDT